MSEISKENSTEENSLLDDLVLNDNDLTEEAKNYFTYHTDILNAFKVYRDQILRDGNLSHTSRGRLFSNINRSYTNCKQVLNYMAENKQLLSRNLPMIGPVVICGLPRTGTTLIYNLLACDPHCRAPLVTDMHIECTPPIARSDSIGHEQRAAATKTPNEKNGDHTSDATKELAATHSLYAFEEDFHILQHAGANPIFSAMISDDQSELSVRLSDEMKKDFAYDYHKLFLHMLNSVDEPSSHWLLKAFAHLLNLDVLIQHYPNAALIMTHRNIDETLASFCRMMFTFEKMCDIKTNSSSARKALTTQYIQFFDKMIECLIKFRNRPSNSFDVIYDDLIKEPIRTVRGIYDHFGLKWSNEFEETMKTWLRDNPQGKQGRHTYSLDDIDLTHEDIETRYADYINLFLRSSCSDTSQRS